MIRLNNNRSFKILEKGRRVGGTWSDNEYPGCCCDVWSHLYSLSFAPNPNWSREYPTQPEIQRYLTEVARKYDLERNIHFDTSVEGSKFDIETGIWTTTANGGNGIQTYRSRFVVTAVGQLNLPKYPKISGLNQFTGKVMHSARWDHSVDLRGKRIGLIGNGTLYSTTILGGQLNAHNIQALPRFKCCQSWLRKQHQSLSFNDRRTG